jgi:serine/threonine-protein kinase
VAERVLGERYRVVRHLARGGMAEVYLAHDELLDRQVAVKVLFPELAQDSSFVERFRREARAAAGLNHPNIVSVFDFGQDDGSYFIVMEYVDGVTLRDIIRSDGPMDPARAIEIGTDVAAALGVAHRHGVVHRDVKPGNVLIAGPVPERSAGPVPERSAGTVKVADFGIARAGDPRDSLTMTGAVMGTATYLSPEQAQGHPIDHRSDLYSLGVVLYEMLAGRPPFAGATPVAIAYQHLTETPVPPSTHNSNVPAALDAVVLRAMEKDPDARPGSADELRSELLAAARADEPEPTVVVAPPAAVEGVPASTAVLPPVPSAPTAVGPPPAPVPSAAVARRRRAALGLLVLLLLAAVVVVALLSGRGKATVAVPTVVGLRVDEATAAVERAGLRASVEPRRDRPGPPDQVLEQAPVAGARVGRGTTVTLVVPGATTTTASSTTIRRTTTTRQVTTTEAPPDTAPVTVAPTTTPRNTQPTIVPPLATPAT